MRHKILANVLDPIRAELDPRVFDHPASPKPILKPVHAHWIKKQIYDTLAHGGYTDIEQWLTLVLTGSLTTYQFSDDSDCDVSLFVDSKVFPEWSRAEMIALMVDKLDGVLLPGTPHPLQDFVVGQGIKPSDLYKPGLRSGYNIDNEKWIVPPEKDRAHDVRSLEGGWYTEALMQADKMERLLRYEPDQAIKMWHQVHARRQRDMRSGKGDFAPSNLIYKMLAQRGLFPQISETSGEYIAKLGAATRAQMLQYAKEIEQELGPDKSRPVYHFPNGWRIHAIDNYADMEREGRLMGNCFGLYTTEYPKSIWGAHPECADEEGYIERPGTEDGEPDLRQWDVPMPRARTAWGKFVDDSGNYSGPFYSLRDPDNLPHASIDAESADPALGKHNAPIKPEYQTLLDQWGSDPKAREYIAKVGMAEQSGFPELDQAVDEYVQAHPELQDLRDPSNAWGRCEEESEGLANYLKERGFKAYCTSDELSQFGYKGNQKTEDIGAGDFTYPEHAVVEVYGMYGPNNVNNVTIDLTAAQYGHTSEWPKVHGGPSETFSKVSAEDPWQGGLCETYAQALFEKHPEMRLGIAGYKNEDGWTPQHFFAHDDTYAYDSLGKHPLPYYGVQNQFNQLSLDEDPADWIEPMEEHLPAAHEHADRLFGEHTSKVGAKAADHKEFPSGRPVPQQTYYHVAPADAHEEIMRNGIDYSRRDKTRDWRFEMDEPPEMYPEGNYLDSNRQAAQERLEAQPGSYLYEVNADGLQLQPDPFEWTEGAHYTTDPIPPERIKRIAKVGAEAPMETGNGIYWHVSPREYRPDIEATGLKRGPVNTGEGIHSPEEKERLGLPDQPPSVYLFDREDAAREWHDPATDDLWQVDATGLPLHGDAYGVNAVRHEGDIEGHRIKRIAKVYNKDSKAKTAAKTIYHEFRPDPPHPKGSDLEPSLPFIYDPRSEIVHLGPAGGWHWQLIKRVPELQDRYEGADWGQPSEQARSNPEQWDAPVHGEMGWPSRSIQFMSDTDENTERKIADALGAPRPQAPTWEFKSSMEPDQIAKIIYDRAQRGEGATISLEGKEPTTRYGFAPDVSTQTPIALFNFEPGDVEEFIHRWIDKLHQPGKFIGSWVHNGDVVLDVTEGHDDCDTAFERAWNGHQKAMYDSVAEEDIPVRGMDYVQPFAEV